jgi:hypothetical protein
MTRRTTVITPTTQTDAVYELPSQPFARRVVSASIYAFVANGLPHPYLPELKIADVEGNILTAITPTFDLSGVGSGNNANFLFSDVGGVNYAYSAPITLTSIYVPATIPSNLTIPESNLFTVTLWGSVLGDTIPNLVLITEDDDENFMP